MMKLLRAFWKSLAGDKQRESQESGVRRRERAPEGEERPYVDQDDSGSSQGASPGATSAGSRQQPEVERLPSRPAKAREEAPRRTAIIQVGIDFGTSTTKVAYRQAGPGGIVRPLIFDHGLEGVPEFGLPSLAMVDGDGRLLVGVQAAAGMRSQSWAEAMRAFKALLVEGSEVADGARDLREAFDRYARHHPVKGEVLTPETVSFVFLAYAMREARRRIRALPEYRDSRLEFLYNICLPMEHLELNPALNTFRQILAKAECIEGDWPLESGTEWLSDNFSSYVANGSTSLERVFVIPESVAEAASYVSSLRRRPGLHALVDVGAGTTDVSFFNLVNESGREHCYWYSSGNLPIGGLSIERFFEVNGGGALTAGQISAMFNGLREGTQPDLVNGVRVILSRIHTAARPVWTHAYTHLHAETPWHQVEVFLTGGGAEVLGAEEIFANPWWQHLSQQHIRYEVTTLPEPDVYDSLDDSGPFSRMAVAYGLTYPGPELGDYTMPGDCPDQTPPPLPIRPADPTARWV